ncbi:hypothetical protein AA103587_0558 [Gluconobacter kanchanaburiensis NBRC 103587]|nr:hypothetical protein AA103587_0558 [Gluconobacter kanchanaburiensis NBRC 103587]
MKIFSVNGRRLNDKAFHENKLIKYIYETNIIIQNYHIPEFKFLLSEGIFALYKCAF